mmetsp:Transcript_48430/g.75619  ORF Transcript_48430/g.75619 Transcript_48430/m.75619 type:complete len:98 (+) Transcript_48430:350-643(+)
MGGYTCRSTPGLRMQAGGEPSTEDAEPSPAPPAKQTTGFGKLFQGLMGEVNKDMRRYDETGKRTLQATPAQILLLVVGQFAVPIALYQVYKAIKGMS